VTVVGPTLMQTTGWMTMWYGPEHTSRADLIPSLQASKTEATVLLFYHYCTHIHDIRTSTSETEDMFIYRSSDDDDDDDDDAIFPIVIS